jgi:hypothetical protein
MRTTYPAHLILLDFTILTIPGEKQYKSRRSSLCDFLHSAVTSSLLLSTLFSNTLKRCSSLNVWDQGSHSYKIKGKITVLYILISKFFYGRREKILNCTVAWFPGIQSAATNSLQGAGCLLCWSNMQTCESSTHRRENLKKPAGKELTDFDTT